MCSVSQVQKMIKYNIIDYNRIQWNMNIWCLPAVEENQEEYNIVQQNIEERELIESPKIEYIIDYNPVEYGGPLNMCCVPGRGGK